jgi:hypothetical protein
MLFPTRVILPSDHVLIALGRHGHPTFKAIATDERYLNELGNQMMHCKKSQFKTYKVISSHDVFSLTSSDCIFEEALNRIVRDILDGKISTM